MKTPQKHRTFPILTIIGLTIVCISIMTQNYSLHSEMDSMIKLLSALSEENTALSNAQKADHKLLMEVVKRITP